MAVAATVAAAAQDARPPLRDVAQIDDGLMAIAIANDIRERCDGIEARLVRAYFELRALRGTARDLGYSEDEIEAYVTSDAEKARMRAKALDWLAARGVDGTDLGQLCAYGAQAIGDANAVGRLLR